MSRKRCPNQREYDLVFNELEEEPAEALEEEAAEAPPEAEGESGPQLMAKIREMVGDQPKPSGEAAAEGEDQGEKGNTEAEAKPRAGGEADKENQEDKEDVQLGKKRVQRKLLKQNQRNEERKAAEKKINGYYRKSFMGECISGVMYLLCQQLNKESNKVGAALTKDALAVDPGTGRPLHPGPRESAEVRKAGGKAVPGSVAAEHALQPKPGIPHEAGAEGHREHGGGHRAGPHRLHFQQNGGEPVHAALVEPLRGHEVLGKHHSEGGADQIQLTKKRKEEQLKFILSKMGVPLRESQQKFEYMQAQYRAQLNENVARLIESNILDEIFVTEFTKQHDNKHRMHSLDLARMANALLTCPTDFLGGAGGNRRGRAGADFNGH